MLLNNVSFTLYLKKYLPNEALIKNTLSQAIGSFTEADANYCIFPGFCDVHVHFREPGFSYKETVMSGSLAAAHGGYTDVCTMPNLRPVPDSRKHLSIQQKIIDKDGQINIHPYGAITVGQYGERVVRFKDIAEYVIAFSDDGKGIQNENVMCSAMIAAKKLGKIIAAHCEDYSLLNGGYIHEGKYAEIHNHPGICSESEWKQIKRDISLAKETGCKYHICHISCKESVDLVRNAKSDGVDITCEATPHHLLLDENDLLDDGRFKVNPPLRGADDRLALIEGIKDGTVDMIATDHAPHSSEEKSRGLKGSAFGISGLETAFPLLYTYLVKENIISLERLLELMCINPRKRFNIPFRRGFTVWNLNEKHPVNPATFISKGKTTPFENTPVYGKCILTALPGKAVYNFSDTTEEML